MRWRLHRATDPGWVLRFAWLPVAYDGEAFWLEWVQHRTVSQGDSDYHPGMSTHDEYRKAERT